MKATGVLLVFCLLTKAFSAPININVDKKAGPRVSTKEILNLEQQLKVQAGEDKKFYPSEMKHKNVPPPQQVDGLEDKAQAISGVGQQQADPAPEKGPEDAVAKQLVDLAGQITPEQLDLIPERLGPIPAQLDLIPGQFDLAQRDELEAAEKRHEHVDLGIVPEQVQKEDIEAQEADNAIDDVDFYHEPETSHLVAPVQIGSEAPQEVELGDEEGGEGEEEEEALFMQSVIEALRDRPELLQQFLQGRLDDNVPIETRVPPKEDDADRAAVIRAEYLEAMGDGRRRHWGHEGGSYIPADLLDGENLLHPDPVQVEGIRELEAGVPSDIAKAVAAREQVEEEIARQKYAALEEYQQYRGDKVARVVKKGYKVMRPSYNEIRPEYKEIHNVQSEKSSSEEESKEDSPNGDSSSSKESKSDGSSKSEEDQNEQDLVLRKRVDMHQHLMM